MKTAESFLKLCLTEKQLDDTSVYVLSNCLKAMELYKNQQPEPRPIEELFEISEDDDEIEIWVKTKNRKIFHCSYNPFQQRIFVDGGRWSKGEILMGCESFIPVEVPKF